MTQANPLANEGFLRGLPCHKVPYYYLETATHSIRPFEENATINGTEYRRQVEVSLVGDKWNGSWFL
jgi:hypothetical protein